MRSGIALLLVAVFMFCSGTSHAITIALPQSGQKTCYDADGATISCAGTGQDGETQVGDPWPNPRFTVNGEAVTDNLTGLIWPIDLNLMKSRDASFDTDPNAGDGSVTWQHALDYVAKLNTESYLGFTDWRLPSLNELLSLVDLEHAYPALPSGHPFINPPINYLDGTWVSTTPPDVTGSAFYVGLYLGNLPVYGKATRERVMAVRGGTAGSARSSFMAVTKTGQTVSYAANDDGALQSGAAWPVPRFTDRSLADPADLTVRDNMTGLVWAKIALTPGPAACTPNEKKLWQDALDFVKCLNTNSYLGYADWRLPNRPELVSLIDRSTFNNALPAGHPFTITPLSSSIVDRIFWSSDTEAGSVNNAKYAATQEIIYGATYGASYKVTNKSHIWPVRGGYTLTTHVVGSGTITSDKDTITWNLKDGLSSYVANELVTLAPFPETCNIFSEWSGACLGSGSCSVTMSAAKSVTATFAPEPLVNGVCGASNGQMLSLAPTTGLCSNGTPSEVLGTGPWTWDCTGSSCGAMARCSAAKAPDITITSPTQINAAYRGARGVIAFSFTGALTAEEISAAITTESWITTGKITLRSNTGSIAYYVALNPGLARNGIIHIGVKTVTVNQGAYPCKITSASLTPSSLTAAGGDVTLNVTVAPQVCSWSVTAIKVGGEWLTLDGPTVTGDGSMTGHVPPNTTLKPRSTSITVATTDGKSKKTLKLKQSNK